jgi:miniconductance mechanosensitive channel
MEESGAWRIKRAIYVDVNSIKFCDEACIERFKKTDLVGNVVAQQRRDNGQKEGDGAAPTADSLNGRHITNLSMFRAYVTDYLKSRPDLHQEGLTLLVRQLESGPSGMPIELYVFAKTTDWIEYEAIQADVFDHVVAALPQFDLRLFQQPTGADFQALVAAPQTLRAGA